ncbi:MAG: heavy metal translocating P-type ATPase [Salinirussus sp.]
MPTCTLCDLPTGDDPVTAGDVDGQFCCQGCLAVHRELGDVDLESPDTETKRVEIPSDAQSEYLNVDGMHCTACEVYLEHIADESDGIYEADASYAAGALKVVYDPETLDAAEIPDIFSRFGYRVGESIDGGQTRGPTIGRLLVGGVLAMMAMVWYAVFLYPTYLGLAPPVRLGRFDGLYLYAQLWLFASVVLLYTGAPLLRGALVAVRTRRPNVDLLVSIAAVAAYLYSTVVMVLGGGEVYFDVTIVVVMAVSVGAYYEERMKDRAAGLLSDLTAIRVDDARLAETGESVPVSDIDPGTELLVRPGERVPVDGTVRAGSAAVDEALVTGESMPRRVDPGDEVHGGTVVTDAPLRVEAGPEARSTLDRVVQLLWDIQSTRPSAQRFADRIATAFVPLVLGLAISVVVILLITGSAVQAALLTGLGVLVVSCPCALGLATPLAVAAGVTAAADRGIVATSPALFEDGASVDTIVFDKTGTLTDGAMRVLGVYVHHSDRATVQRRAAAVEALSAHPIAAAIASATSVDMSDVADFEDHGKGVEGTIDGCRVTVGAPEFVMDRGHELPAPLAERVEAIRQDSAVPVAVGWDGDIHGVLAVGDQPRSNWASVVGALAADHRIVVLSGDDEAATTRFTDHPGVDEVYAGVPPEGKAATVARLAESERVAMVGDGSNDAPALAAADIGIAMAGGTELAGDAADAVIVGDDLGAVPAVFEVASATRRRIRTNLGWAFLYNAVAIPLAVVGVLNPLFAALAMTTSSLLVVANSAREIGDSDISLDSSTIASRETPTPAYQ